MKEQYWYVDSFNMKISKRKKSQYEDSFSHFACH